MVKLQDKVYAYGQFILKHDELSKLNAFGAKMNKPLKQCLHDLNCETTVVAMFHLEVQEDEKQSEKIPTSVNIVKIELPCLDLDLIYKNHNQHVIEKNWQFFEYKQRIYFEYLLHSHKVYSLGSLNKLTKCGKLFDTHSDMEEIRSKYQHAGLFFSPGGSIVPYDPEHYIGAGHVKYAHEKEPNLLGKVKGQGRFYHSVYVYAMFLYLVKREPPFKIVKFSSPFIPSSELYSLVFPMSICFSKKNHAWIIAYGEGDDTANLLYLKPEAVETLLSEQPTPETFRVGWLATESPHSSCFIQ